MSVRESRFGWLRILGVTAVAVGAALAVSALGGTESRAAAKYTVQAGGGGSGIAVEMFRPKDIFIHAGDTVEWVNPYEEIHTVTFLDGAEEPELIVPAGAPPKNGPPTLMFNPVAAFPTSQTTYTGGFANSGIIGKGQTYSLSFNNVGTYKFLCILHEGMEGTVQVLNPGTTLPTQAALDADAQVQLDKAIKAGQSSAAATKTSNTKHADGTTDWGVTVPQSVGQSDVMQFVPVSLNISVGDSVSWSNNTPVPHTVTYTGGGPVPDLTVPQPQPAGPPNLILNPAVLFPSVPPVKNFEGGSALINSGFMGTGPEATAGTTFSLTFTKAGTYLFVCALHADQGMSSLITVGAASGRVSPPSTGDAGLADRTGSTMLYVLTAVIAVAFLGGAGAFRFVAVRK